MPAPTAHMRQQNFVHSGIPTTGIGYSLINSNHYFSVILISPTHCLIPRHAASSGGTTLRFMKADGTIVERTVGQFRAITDGPQADGVTPNFIDIGVSTLTQPLTAADGFTFFPVLNLALESQYLSPQNRNLQVFGRLAQGASNTAGGFATIPDNNGNETRTLTFDYITATAQTGEAGIENGDSGSPVLTTIGGQTSLVAMNYAAGTLTNVLGQPVGVRGFSSHVGRPQYMQLIDEKMAPEGYALTRTNQTANTATISTTAPPVIRAGYSFSLTQTISVGNAGDVHNLSLAATADPALSATGTTWVANGSATPIALRRGKITQGGNTALTYSGTIASSGSQSLATTISGDEISDVSESFTFTVLPSYLEAAAGLLLDGQTEDADDDGRTNLEEYAFGGALDTRDRFVSGTMTPLDPVVSEDGANVKIVYQRRTDAAQRGLTYQVQQSSTLLAGSFADVTNVSETTTPSVAGFETVTVTCPATPTRKFLRLEVALAEDPNN